MLRPALENNEINDAIVKNNKVYYPSKFLFLNAINGIRKGNLNGFIGTTGSGKSTLIKAIIADTAKHSKVLVWLTEESISEYQPKINQCIEDERYLKNISFIEESSLPAWCFGEQDAFFSYLKRLLVESGAEVMFIDNITSGFLYSDDIDVSGQGRSAIFLSKIAKELGVAIVYVAHTKKNVNDTYSGLITKEDIRGSQKISIVTEYLFILQTINSNRQRFPVIIISKNRHHQIEDKYYILKFADGVFQKDKKIDFELVKKIFSARERL